MPVYYSPQDPARYYQGEQSRRDQNFQNMLRMMMQLQALRQRQGQFEQTQALNKQKFALSEKQLASLERSRQAQAKRGEAYQKYLEANAERWKNAPTQEEKDAKALELYTKKQEILSKFRQPKPPKQDPKIKNRLGIVEDAIAMYEGALKDLKTDLEADPTVVNNINYALEELYGAKTRLGDDKLIEGDQWNTVRRIAASPTYVKSGAFLKRKNKMTGSTEGEFIPRGAVPPGAQTATNPKTGERVALINGKWVKIK